VTKGVIKNGGANPYGLIYTFFCEGGNEIFVAMGMDWTAGNALGHRDLELGGQDLSRRFSFSFAE
jgi:hypothetical protein